MSDMNSVMLDGSICDIISSPSVLSNGAGFVTFTVQTERDYTNAEGEKRKEYSVVGCEAYGALAKVFRSKAENGGRVHIVGHLKQNVYNSRGEVRQSLVVIAEHIDFRA